MSTSRYFVLLTIVVTALGLAGCGGGGDDAPPAPAPTTFSVGGNVSGLTGSVGLRLNGANDLTVSASGTFTFSNQLASGTAYTVSVQTQPATQTCVVTNATGNVTANVSNVAVACSANTFTIGGALSGLNGTVVLQNNGGNDLSLTADGNFTFSTAVNSGAAYAVTVLTQPAGQTCAVTNDSGNASANVTNVAVDCTNTAPVTIGGTVTGLTAGTLLLQNNLGDNLTVTTSPFTFATPVAANSAYFVSVAAHPVGLTCDVTDNGSGISATTVTDVEVTCVNNAASTVTVGGTVSGLVGAGPFTLRNIYNALVGGGPVIQDIQITSNGQFTFPAIPRRSVFSITALTQPTGQTCSVSANNGLSVTDITNVVVDCTNGSTVYTVGGTISGLTQGPLILTLSANNNALVVPATATQFTFPNGLISGTEYSVGLGLQPPGLTCVLTDSSDEIAAANSTSVVVTCTANTTDPLVGTYEIVGQDNFITLYPDGTYLIATRENDAGCGMNSGNGVEVGVYNYDSGTGAFSVVSNAIDTNGDCGLWDGTGMSGTVQKSGVGQGSSITFDDGSDTFTLESVTSVANTFIGGFRLPGSPDFVILGDDGRYTLTHSTNDSAGIEYGCYTLTGTTSGDFTPDVTPATCAGTVDTNGDAGFTDADDQPLPYSVLSPYVMEAFERVLVRIVPN